MRTIKIKTKRFKNYRPNKVEHLTGNYAGTGENVRGFINYNPSYDSTDERTATGGTKTGYRSDIKLSIK